MSEPVVLPRAVFTTALSRLQKGNRYIFTDAEAEVIADKCMASIGDKTFKDTTCAYWAACDVLHEHLDPYERKL